MKLSRKMILVPEEEYLQLTQTNTGKPEEKCTKMDESAENFTIMQQPRQKSTKIGASTENSTQTESALDENPIQSKWEFEKRTEIDQPNKNRTKFTQWPEKHPKFTQLPEIRTTSTQLQKFFTKTTQPVKPRGPPGIPSLPPGWMPF